MEEHKETVSSKTKSNLPLILSGLILLIIVGAGSYFLGKQSAQVTVQPTPTVEPMNQPTESAQTQPTIDPTANWNRKQFGNAWNIKYPSNWEINDLGVNEGSLILKGEYNEGEYQLNLGYPLTPKEKNIEEFINSDLDGVSENKKAEIKRSDIIVNNASAKKLLNVPIINWVDQKPVDTGQLSHRVYIWKYNSTNPRRISLEQLSPQFNSQQAETLLDLFIKEIN